MNILERWAKWHNIPEGAYRDLLSELGALPTGDPSVSDGWSEMMLQNQVRLKESERGNRAYRNNRGVAYDKTGRPVRYGLGNDSTNVDAVSKSSDLIGIEPVLITADMVGKIIGRFFSLEIKRPGWVFKGTPRENAQLNWIVFINSMGGRATFVSSMEYYEQEETKKE